MDANNNDDQEDEAAHEIPADPSASSSENEEKFDKKTKLNGTSSQNNSSGGSSNINNAPSENTGNNGGREQNVTANTTTGEDDGGGRDEIESNTAQDDGGGTNDRHHAINEEGSNNHSYDYANNDNPPQMMFEPNNSSSNIMMYPTHNNNSWQQHQQSQFFSPFGNNGPQQQPFDPSAASAPPNSSPFSYDPLSQPLQQPMPMNGLPPMQLPPVPPSLPPIPNNPSPDATRQYYEARMREHAMHYANAAAGESVAICQYYEARMREHAMQYASAASAWAAARIACGVPDNNAIGGMPGGFPMMANNQHSSPSYYTPASAPVVGHPSHTNANQGMALLSKNDGPQQPKRTLWKPHSSLVESKNSSKEGSGSYNSSKVPKKGGSKPSTTTTTLAAVGEAPPKPSPSNNTETKLLRNDSVSSLGSESRDRLSVGGGNGGNGNNFNTRDIRRNSGSSGGCGSGKRSGGGKKGNQRRRFNEDDGAPSASPRNAAAVNNNNGSDKRSDYHSNNKQNDNRHHLRQKRGLHHGHSSRGSFSSFGSGTNNSNPHQSSGGSGRNKKKNRSQQLETPGNNDGGNTSGPTSIHLGGLTGKNGARALHELCSKYRWEMPKYNSIETSSHISNNFANENSTDGNANNDSNGSTKNVDISFVLTVHVNGVELGRGRGGTKVSAKQDASRKALAALVPGVVFDPNGILLDVGSSNVENTVYSGGESNVNNNVDSNDKHANPLKDEHSRPFSPDHSEDSSISTAISEELLVSGGGPLISGGPLSQMLVLQQLSPPGVGGGGRFFSSNIYPCASTTSGVSSSDVDEEDENAYYSSRGASVCSTLLHAMWQIDDRIREPPSYAFDICPSTPYAPVKHSGDAVTETALGSSGGAACSKRKKVESSREVATVRMFQCVASLNLYFPKHLEQQGEWESPLDYLQLKKTPVCERRGDSSQSRKRKDSFASQSSLSPTRPLGDGGLDEQVVESPKEQEEEECVQRKLESLGTGSTKRESKHKASAKLLAALFPGCNSMLEVKAEAEAARELYAANKTESQTKRSKLTISSRLENQSSTLSNALPAPGSRSLLNQTHADMKPISLHALSLSEPKEGSKRIKWSDSNVEPDLERHHHYTAGSIENEVDHALQSLQEFDEDYQWGAGAGSAIPKELSFDDVGKIILRRALLEDTDYVHVLLNKNEALSTDMPATRKKNLPTSSAESTEAEIDVPLSEPDHVENSAVGEENLTEDNKKRTFLFGENSILLVLSRAVALHDPPLGCASLTLEYSSKNEARRNLNLCRLGHERHLPRERFVECLSRFSDLIQCDLDTSGGFAGSGLAEVTSDDIRSFLSRSPTPYHTDDVVGSMKGNSSSHLQSVKEEDSEEAGDGSDGGREDSDNKIDAGGSGLVKGRPSKPSKRSRVA